MICCWDRDLHTGFFFQLRYRPVTCWCFGFLHHQICTSATHVGIQLFPNTGRSYLQFGAQLTLQETCWLFGGLKSSVQHCWTVESCGTMLYQHEHRGSHDRKGLPGVAATDAGTVGVGCSSRRMRNSSFFVIFKKMIKGMGSTLVAPKLNALLGLLLLNSMSNLCRLVVLNFDPYSHWVSERFGDNPSWSSVAGW